MRLMIITSAALGALALAACTPAEDEMAEDAAATGAETSTIAPADGGMGTTPDSTTPVNPDGTTTPPGQTPILPTDPNDPNAPTTSPPPPM